MTRRRACLGRWGEWYGEAYSPHPYGPDRLAGCAKPLGRCSSIGPAWGPGCAVSAAGTVAGGDRPVRTVARVLQRVVSLARARLQGALLAGVWTLFGRGPLQFAL